jgi:hypothetical protein
MNNLIKIYNNIIQLSGYDMLNFYDCAEYINLDFNTNNFIMCDGASQHANLYVTGTFTIDDDNIIFNYDKSLEFNEFNEYEELLQETKFNYKINEEINYHFNGYSKMMTKYTLHFDKSPFNNTIIFYINPEIIDCDVKYEILVRNEINLKKFFVKNIIPLRQEILIPNTEEIRKLNLEINQEKITNRYIIIYYSNSEKIIGIIINNEIIFISKNENCSRYYIPGTLIEEYKDNIDYELVHSTYYPTKFMEFINIDDIKLYYNNQSRLSIDEFYILIKNWQDKII